MRQSMGQANTMKQYTNKENVMSNMPADIQMRSTSGGPTATSHQQNNTNSGSQLASRHHHMPKG